MASQEDAEEPMTPKQPTLKTMCMDSPVQDNRRREHDGERSGAKRPKPEPLRIAQLREDVQLFLRAEAKEKKVPGPMYQQKLSESFRCLAPKNAAGSTMQNATDMTPDQTPSMPNALGDSREDVLHRLIIAAAEVVADADAENEVADTGKERAGLEATAPMEHRDDKMETEDKVPSNHDNACKDTASPKSRTQCRGTGSVPSGDDSCDTEATGEDEAFPRSSVQRPDGVAEAEIELSDQRVYALLLEMHNKFEIMGRSVGAAGGPSIGRVRSALAELPATVRDLGDMPNIKKDLAEKHRLGKHQMREVIRRIEFFFVLAENQYKDKLAKNLQ